MTNIKQIINDLMLKSQVFFLVSVHHSEYSAHRSWHLYRIYSIPTHDKHQWLLLQFIVLLKMGAKGVRNMQSILVVFNKHNTARVVSCWFIIYYKFKTSTLRIRISVKISNNIGYIILRLICGMKFDNWRFRVL